MFRQSEQLLTELQGHALELATLEPDGNGNFQVALDDNIGRSGPGDDDRASEPEDRRQVIFINSRRLFPAGR